jgi:hypothetical protein
MRVGPKAAEHSDVGHVIQTALLRTSSLRTLAAKVGELPNHKGH